MSLNDRLMALLKTDRRFVDDDGELVLAAVESAAWRSDVALVRLLLADAELHAEFVLDVDGYGMFNADRFVTYIREKSFLDNSYTRFRNRIGLTIGGKFLSERGEVALAWPYKDCVLEGGQTKEEESRKELFFNEVLARDEINRLLDPKALTGWRRYTANGDEPVTDLARDENGVLRENLIIKGNNLLALHSLMQQFRGQVKLIYIDPPYNTGNDGFNYNDSFNHSSWLTFIKNRLDVARSLLREDGVIFVQITDAEMPYLRLVMDEVLGRECFVEQIVWRKRGSAPNDQVIGAVHEYIALYSKGATNEGLHKPPRTVRHLRRYSNPDGHPKGPWAPDNLMSNVKGGRYVESLYYAIRNPQTGEMHYPSSHGNWRFSRDRVEQLLANSEIYFGQDGTGRPKLKRFLCDIREGVSMGTIWDDVALGTAGTGEMKGLFGSVNTFDTAKPEELIQRVLDLGSREGDIVLDFCLGSGTTAAVAHKMGRQYIGVEQMDYITTIPVERLKKVIAGEQGGVSKAVNWLGGGEFIYCELLRYNETWMERIQAAQTSDALLELWGEMAEGGGSFLKWYVNAKAPEQAMDDFVALGTEPGGLDKQKHLLAALLDKNQLYVNLSEIGDERYGVSDEDKRLNRAFYGGQP